MDYRPDSPEEKLIVATIACIEEGGFHNLTIRSIAGKAGMNSAAVNYYFRSKENLIEATLRHSLRHAFEDLPDTAGIPRPEALRMIKAWFLHFLGGGFNYPGLTRAYLYPIIMERNYEGLIAKNFIGFIERFAKIMAELNPGLPASEAAIASVQCLSALIFPILAPGLIDPVLGCSLAEPEAQDRFLDRLMERFFRPGE